MLTKMTARTRVMSSLLWQLRRETTARDRGHGGSGGGGGGEEEENHVRRLANCCCFGWNLTLEWPLITRGCAQYFVCTGSRVLFAVGIVVFSFLDQGNGVLRLLNSEPHSGRWTQMDVFWAWRQATKHTIHASAVDRKSQPATEMTNDAIRTRMNNARA